MTEKTTITVASIGGPWLRDPGPRRERPAPPPRLTNEARSHVEPYGTKVNVIAFALTVVATPLMIGIIGIPLVLPPFAAVFGLPVYLMAGVPAFWLLAQQMHRNGLALCPRRFAKAGFFASFFAPFFYSVYFSVSPSRVHPNQDTDLALVFWAFGALFAPLFGAVFGATYRSLAKTFAA